MTHLTTSLYAVAHITNPYFDGRLTDGKEYPVYKILERSTGRQIIIINDEGKMEAWGAWYFTFIQR